MERLVKPGQRGGRLVQGHAFTSHLISGYSVSVVGEVNSRALALCDLPAVPASCTEARHAVHDALADVAVNIADVELVVTEAVTNVVVHAYRDRDAADGLGRFLVTLTIDDDAGCVVVADDGVGLAPRTDSPGLGIGLPLIASVCDALEIEQRDDGTRIHMRFAVRADARGDG